MNFANYLNYLLDSTGREQLKLKTYWYYNNVIDQYIIPHLGNMEVEQITTQIIHNYIKTLITMNKLTMNVIHIIICVLKKTLNLYYNEELKQINPLHLNFKLPLNYKKREALSKKDEKELTSYILKGGSEFIWNFNKSIYGFEIR